jgi:hypothetical protein
LSLLLWRLLPWLLLWRGGGLDCGARCGGGLLRISRGAD